ncbi:IS1380 family transposase [Sorangium sp. So ce119]|uniref:IS1380 family transposase n=1 Tax=Sorangium sp. So ce119 TaxID=3133279 RepID=UPI003F5F532A
MTKRRRTPSTSKVRRLELGFKSKGDGRHQERIRRPDPSRIHVESSEKNLTGIAGLAPFGAFLRELGVDAALSRRFFRLKTGRSVIYPMAAQMRLLMDCALAGEERVFGIEALAVDPLFVRLAGGVVPSIDTVYRDLCRFDEQALEALHSMVVDHGLALVARRKHRFVHIDVDTTVEPLFGMQEGALPGPNPRYHGRPSYHPILARIAEADAIVGAKLRPGDTSFGEADVPFVEECIDRARAAAPSAVIYVRIDGAGDCSALMHAVAARGRFFLTKARMSPDLVGMVAHATGWRTIDRDADGRPRRQVAEVPFRRGDWPDGVRVIAVRTRDRENGKQIYLWEGLDYTVQVFLTNEPVEAPEDVAARYDLRAGIEPLIGDLKHGWGCGRVPSHCFNANHAALLLKLLTANLMRRYVLDHVPQLASWRTPWLRRALILVPGRLARSSRGTKLHVPERSQLARWHN